MPDPTQRAYAGKPLSIPAAAWNDLLSMLAAWKAGRLCGSLSGGPGAPVLNPTVVRIRNNSTDFGAGGQFGVLGIDGVEITEADNAREFTNNFTLNGVLPYPADRAKLAGRIAVLQRPLKRFEVGKAVIAGITPCRVSITNEAHRYADFNWGSATELKSGRFGPVKILYAPAGTGTKLCLVQLAAGDERLLMKITNSTRDSSNWRWVYQGKVVTPATTAFGAWEEEVTLYNVGFNCIEHDNNASSTAVQSGIDLSDPDVAGIEPVPPGTVVPATLHLYGTSGLAFYFSYPNQPIIQCGGG